MFLTNYIWGVYIDIDLEFKDVHRQLIPVLEIYFELKTQQNLKTIDLWYESDHILTFDIGNNKIYFYGTPDHFRLKIINTVLDSLKTEYQLTQIMSEYFLIKLGEK